MEHNESKQVETESTETTEERLVVEVPTEIRAGRSVAASGYCLYPRGVAA